MLLIAGISWHLLCEGNSQIVNGHVSFRYQMECGDISGDERSVSIAYFHEAETLACVHLLNPLAFDSVINNSPLRTVASVLIYIPA